MGVFRERRESEMLISAADILKARILVVDDTRANVLLLEDMLGGAGYSSVRSTGDSREVCDLHKKGNFDLIVLDLLMPEMDGFQVMARLKEIEPGGELSILVITAQPDHKLRAIKAGAKGFVSKPFDLPEVLVQVHNLIEVRLLRRSADLHSAMRIENSQRIAKIGDWEYNYSDNHRIWSDEIFRILGVSNRGLEPDPSTYEGFVHPDDREFFRRQRAGASVTDHRSDFEHRVLRPDGDVRHIHYVIEVRRDPAGRALGEAGIVQDITERKLAEENLRKSEERYRTMLIISPDAHMVIAKGVISFVNQAFCRLTGAAEPIQWIGRPLHDVIQPDFHPLVDELLEREGEMGAKPREEIKFMRLDGTSVDVEISHAVFDFHGGRELQLIARDITERKRLELHFRQAHKMEALGRFSGGIALSLIHI